MAKFKLIIKELNQGYVNVEAEDRDAAEEMALGEYNNGNVVWTDSSISHIEAKEGLD